MLVISNMLAKHGWKIGLGVTGVGGLVYYQYKSGHSEFGNFRFLPEKYKTKFVCKQAFKKDPMAFEYIPKDKQNEEMYKIIDEKKIYKLIKNMPDDKKTQELCNKAFKQSNYNIEYIPKDKLTEEILLDVAKNNKYLIKYIPLEMRTAKFWQEYISSGGSLSEVQNNLKTPELCKLSVENNINNIAYVPDYQKTDEICKIVMSKDYFDLMKYIPENKFTPTAINEILLNDVCKIYYLPKSKLTNNVYDLAMKININQYGKCIREKQKRVITGKQFNEITKGKKFIKLTNVEEVHNGYKFKTGLNEDDKPFNPNDCSKGGIYFVEDKYANKWANYEDKFMVHYREATIPDDAFVYLEDHKFKTNKINLGEKKLLKY